MPKILNSKGQEIVLNERERFLAAHNQKQVNALGFEVDITTLTTIMKKVTEQKFFEIAPADFIPVRVGEGSWSSNLLTYRSFLLADDFSTGIVNTGGNSGRLAAGDAGVDSVSVAVKNWAKEINWSIMDLEMAAKAGNWDLVTAKEKSRKKNWDLGIQKIAFLGMAGQSDVLGLLNQAGIAENTTVITKAIKSMTGTELKAFCAAVLAAYRSNCARSAWPTHFAIPESDYLGLAAPSSADFPLKSVLAVLEETFQVMTGNKAFKILPCAYGDAAVSGAAYQRYALYNSEEESIRMDIPVDYTNTLANSVNNFSFQNVAYGQFTGVVAYRPLELLYFQYNV
jgi:hypothetical protein